MKTVLHTEASPGLGGQEVGTLNGSVDASLGGMTVRLCRVALAAAIERVLDDPEAAARRAGAACALVEERFSRTSAVGRLLDLYGELLA